MKVSSVLCTYGRFESVQRSIGMWISQDYKKGKELVLFNTAPTPLILSDELSEYDIKNIHAPTNSKGDPFSSLGEVRQDALSHTTGFLYSCWDDDDLFLPFHLSQAVSKFQESDCIAWKPEHSLFSQDGGKTFKLAGNAMEASIIARMDFVKEHGFSTKQSGGEHVQGGWLDICRARRGLRVENVRPSYAYVWGDGLHKTSGSIDNPNNFFNHMNASQDYGEGRKIVPTPLDELKERFAQAYVWE